MLRVSAKSIPKPLGSVRSIYNAALTSDINITPAGKVNLTVGAGGRSSRTGYTATVFGASGFLGRYLTSRLARHGTITVVPFRDEMKKRFLKVQGDLGVVNFVEFDARNLKSIEDSVAHSDIVFNCIGTDYSTKNFSMADVNIALTERITQAVKDAGVPRLVHVSSYNADPKSDSIFYATKGIGEQVVRGILPSATIVRPAPMYGREDNLLNYLGPKLKMWTPNKNAKQIYPLHVIDAARALEVIGYNDATIGQTFELYGPEMKTFSEIRQMIHGITQDFTQAGPITYNHGEYYLPLPLLQLVAQMKQYIYWKTTNPDQIQRHLIDQKIDPNAKTFKDLGIEDLDQLGDVLFTYVKHWRHPLIAQQGQNNSKEDARLREIQHFT
ncbi:39kDa subunit of ndufa9, NADH:ubiquinone oxidoreductase [Scheffersomyces spartinae]|uniref:39kDa subunit of ndufa9, NADH:ubiquinone oxidoreductase n=1 Tax=Scheffersomyces spartinae TaxID=45513 RepID=A0A9P8AJP6_9ASCO|nr:39kDa subunit of ndufa9, NADH:ubiquinone oxidoreductase [Scheffersomyces spartinae]KAG7194327.1 39kDa subunit of ndufa9, NADH:ubiquinone oxidoreductase [Scheffersomyces spartinae]